jgi:hypothetical protein
MDLTTILYQDLAWPDPSNPGGWVDAWNGAYTDFETLLSEAQHWTARVEDRVLAHGEGLITEDEAERRRTSELQEFEVSVRNTFEAVNAEEAVEQMVEWIQEYAGVTAYRVNRVGFSDVQLIDAEDL